MRTANGTQLTLSPATANILKNILTEWINERTPLEDYLQRRYRNHGHDPAFVGFKEKVITERIVRLQMVIDQLEDTV